MGKVKSVNQYRLTPGFGGFTPVSHVTTACRLPCRWRGIRRKRAAFGKRTILYGCAIAVGCTPVLYGVFRGFGLNRIT